jgi:surface antigen
MKNLRTPITACVICIGLSGCTATTGSNQATGTAVGATGGALAGALIANSTGGSPWVGALIGGLAGGLIGGAIGAQLDEQERHAMEAALQGATVAKANKKIAWTSPTPSKKSGKKTTGYVIPGEIYTNAAGQKCRNIEQVAEKDGQTIQGKTTACKTEKGWTEAAV